MIAARRRHRLPQREVGKNHAPTDVEALIEKVLGSQLPQLSKDLRELRDDIQALPKELRGSLAAPVPPAMAAIKNGEQRYQNIPVPILAIFAVPHNFGDFLKNDPAAREAVVARDTAWTEAQAAALQAGIPSARVVRLPNADHYVFRSNEDDVLREMNAFIRRLH